MNKSLGINKIKVWHGICYVISENEWKALPHGVMFLILMFIQGSFVAKRDFLILRNQGIITIKTQ